MGTIDANIVHCLPGRRFREMLADLDENMEIKLRRNTKDVSCVSNFGQGTFVNNTNIEILQRRLLSL